MMRDAVRWLTDTAFSLALTVFIFGVLLLG
jgi:hypothetical protein